MFRRNKPAPLSTPKKKKGRKTKIIHCLRALFGYPSLRKIHHSRSEENSSTEHERGDDSIHWFRASASTEIVIRPVMKIHYLRQTKHITRTQKVTRKKGIYNRSVLSIARNWKEKKNRSSTLSWKYLHYRKHGHGEWRAHLSRV